MQRQNWSLSTMEYLHRAKFVMDDWRAQREVSGQLVPQPGSDEYFAEYLEVVRRTMDNHGFNVDAPLVVSNPLPVDPALESSVETACKPVNTAHEQVGTAPEPVESAPEPVNPPAASASTTQAPAIQAAGDTDGDEESFQPGSRRTKCPRANCTTLIGSEKSLQTHITNQHTPKPGSSCWICPKTFRNDSTLRQHYENHHKLDGDGVRTAMEASKDLASIDPQWLQPRFEVQDLVPSLRQETLRLNRLKLETTSRYRQMDEHSMNSCLESFRHGKMFEGETGLPSLEGMDQRGLINELIKTRVEIRAWKRDLEELKRVEALYSVPR
ncbi:uncharacterized protein QC761_0000180 [Podospora bellae-mahoneyi]|uniref:C2H2-type domain-containing protein n=1 Tax=Podospora bellae-mahoneyi TaxID=2093777 RepID=A0ABR0FWF3_9PEZI|nr:hypothetical protein QC761_0000180 [Podospora bellae-mahoneyi]